MYNRLPKLSQGKIKQLRALALAESRKKKSDYDKKIHRLKVEARKAACMCVTQEGDNDCSFVFDNKTFCFKWKDSMNSNFVEDYVYQNILNYLKKKEGLVN